MIGQTYRQTGYPSEDKPWLKYYDLVDKQVGIELVTHATVWDVIERKFEDHMEVPAIEYFGRRISRKDFRDLVYQWAGILHNMDVCENEVVPIYGCLTPDVAAMIFALNILGAVPYFLKLAISPQALAEETEESRFAIVFTGMWENVKDEFLKDKYKWVLLYDVTDGMNQPQRSLLSIVNVIKNRNKFSKNKKIFRVDQVC